MIIQFYIIQMFRCMFLNLLSTQIDYLQHDIEVTTLNCIQSLLSIVIFNFKKSN